MPAILSLPRELRDEIYHHSLKDNLQSSQSYLLQHSRKAVRYDSTNSDTYYGEDQVLYPEFTTLPPSYSLLRTCRQLRAEMLDCIKRMGPLRYKIDLTKRNDKDRLYPTWISVPAFSRHVDILDVGLRFRGNKTSSVVSVPGDDHGARVGSCFDGGLALLERFLERGIYFLSKKKRHNISIGVLAVNIDVPPEDESELRREKIEIIELLDSWLLGEKVMRYSHEEKKEEARQFRFLAGKVERLRLSVMGTEEKEWVLADVIAARDEKQRADVIGDIVQ